jgi:hypothetical protein
VLVVLVLVITGFIVNCRSRSDVDDRVEAKATASTTEGGNGLVEALDENAADKELAADDCKSNGFEVVAKGDGNDREGDADEANDAEDTSVGLEEAGNAEASEIHTVSPYLLLTDVTADREHYNHGTGIVKCFLQIRAG